MKRFPAVGEKVYIRGYETLPFEVVAINKGEPKPIRLVHPLTGTTMTFKQQELVDRDANRS